MIRLLLAALLLGAACTPQLGGALRPDGYHHNLFPMHMRSINNQSQQFVSLDWRLDNFKMGTEGWEQKLGPGYANEAIIDLSGDTTADTPARSTTQVPAFDVLLKHRRTGAQMWMRTELLPVTYRERTLETLVAEYAERLSGTAFIGVSVYPYSVGVTRAYATKVVSSNPTKVGDRDAHEAVIEVANLDQLRLDPQSRAAIMHVVFVETGYPVYQPLGHGRPRGGAAEEATPPHRVQGRVVVVLGYSAAPASYEQLHGDFARFRDALKMDPPKPEGYTLQ
jgi:hypothetical protein